MARSLFAVLPVKPFEEGKSRLSGLLSPAERIALNRELFELMLDRLVDHPGANRTIVVSRSAEVLALARSWGCVALEEPPPHGLNAAVLWGVLAAREQAADAVVVMPVDLPTSTTAALRALCDALPDAPTCLLVPDHHRRGTNLLLQSPPLLDQFAFGPDSLARHRALAAGAGLLAIVREHPAFAHDIDGPDDYQRWRIREDGALAPI
jgi:2-phospho-L-lactate guanylyltransferase